MLLLRSNNDDGDAVLEIRKSLETGTITPNTNLQTLETNKITYQPIKSL
jgi:hypothetical protein